MKINIAQIKKKQSLAERIVANIEPVELEISPEDVLIDGDLLLDFLISNVGDVVLLDGKIQALVIMSCSRCNTTCKTFCTGEFKEKFYPFGTEAINDDELVFSDDIVDITEVVREALLLSLPMTTLCKEECKGLCDICGIDKNTQECSCEEQKINPRFAVLQGLLKK